MTENVILRSSPTMTENLIPEANLTITEHVIPGLDPGIFLFILFC